MDVEFHSLSKTYYMTGWCFGWAAGRPDVLATLTKVKSFVDTGPFMALQAAGVAALESYAEFVPHNVSIFRERRDAAVEAFGAAGFGCEPPRATMYLWMSLPEGIASAPFAERLLSEEGVVLMPGSAFGAGGEGYVRASFIAPPARIAEAAQRAGGILGAFGREVA